MATKSRHVSTLKSARIKQVNFDLKSRSRLQANSRAVEDTASRRLSASRNRKRYKSSIYNRAVNINKISQIESSYNNTYIECLAEKKEAWQTKSSTTGSVTSSMPEGRQKSQRDQDIRHAAEAAKSAIDQLVAAIDNPKRLEKSMHTYTQSARVLAAQVLGKMIQEKCKDVVDVERLADSDRLRTFEQKNAFAHEIREMLEPWNLGFNVPGYDGVFRLFANPNFTGNPLGALLLKLAGASNGTRINSWSVIAATIRQSDLADCPSNYLDRSAPQRGR